MQDQCGELLHRDPKRNFKTVKRKNNAIYLLRLCSAIFFLAALSNTWGQCWPYPGCIPEEREGKKLRSLIQTLPDYGKTTLTGDWNGKRQKLAEQGILFSLDLDQNLQGNAHGGDNTNGAIRYGGLVDTIVRFDLARMGLWEGGMVVLHGQSQFGCSGDCDVGSVIPVNFDMTEPRRDQPGATALSEWYYAQALSEHFVIAMGKIDIIGGREDVTLGTQKKYQFMNVGLRTNPALAPFIPYTPLTFAGIWIPNKNVRLTTGIMDNEPGTTATTPGFKTAFHGPRWFTFGQDLQITVKPFGRDGHQVFGYTYMHRGYRLLEQAPTCGVPLPTLSNLLRPDLPIEAVQLAADAGLPPFFRNYYNCRDAWLGYYRFDQFIYQEPDDPTQGWGFFGRFGAGSSKCNPIEAFYCIGVQGKGGIPKRDNDNYGIGYYHVNLSDHLPNILGTHSEQGIEAFYNIQIRPGVLLTPDLQIIINPGGGVGNLDVAVVYGLRLQISL